MRLSVLEYVLKKQGERGDSDTRTAKLLGVAQPSFHKFKQGGVSIRAEFLINYVHNTGYEVALIPKEHVGLLNDSVVLLDHGFDVQEG